MCPSSPLVRYLYPPRRDRLGFEFLVEVFEGIIQRERSHRLGLTEFAHSSPTIMGEVAVSVVLVRKKLKAIELVRSVAQREA